MPRLSKREVEALLRDYDADPVTALTAGLRIALAMPGAAWDALVAAAPLPAERKRALLERSADALDDLLRELNEERDVTL